MIKICSDLADAITFTKPKLIVMQNLLFVNSTIKAFSKIFANDESKHRYWAIICW